MQSERASKRNWVKPQVKRFAAGEAEGANGTGTDSGVFS
jgi:hypothetical protein